MNTKLFTVALVLSALASVAHAQTATSTPLAPSQIVTVATVNIQNAAILSQEGNTIHIGFDISNREGVQPQVVYAVNLLKKEASGQYSLADKTIYSDDVQNLGANQSIHKEIEYQALPFLKGAYKIGLEARNPEGLPFALIQIDREVTLGGSGEGVEASSNTCFLTVEGEKAGTKYTLDQGVDISAEEHLMAHCTVKGDFKNSVSVTPVFQTFYRTAFGKEVGNEKLSSLTLKSGQSVEYVGEISKSGLEPQAYEAVLSFLNAVGERVSPSIYFHYVLRGESATIQNLTLDKDYYAKGETANISLLWTGPASAFPGMRGQATLLEGATLSLNMVNDQNVSCIAPISKNLASASGQIVAPIITDCSSPTVSVEIKNQSGKVLAQKSITIQSHIPESKADTKTIVLYGVIILLALVGISLLFRKSKESVTAVALLLILSAGLLGAPHAAKADTFSGWYEDCTYYPASDFQFVTGSNFLSSEYIVFLPTGEHYFANQNIWADTDIYGNVLSDRLKICSFAPTAVSATISLDWSSYAPGQKIIASGVGWVSLCGNTTPATYLYATINGVKKVLAQGSQNISGSADFTAQSPPQTTGYNAIFDYNIYTNGGANLLNSYSAPLPYTVVVPPPAPTPINGVCGTSAYNCTSGTSVNNVDTGTAWTWDCNGINNGIKATPSCSLAKPAGLVAASITITVAPGLNFSIGSDPNANVTSTSLPSSNTGANLSWSSTNADSCTATGPWVGSIAIPLSGLSPGWNTGPLTTTTTYAITCTGPGGSVGPKSVTVNVAPAPSVNLYFTTP